MSVLSAAPSSLEFSLFPQSAEYILALALSIAGLFGLGKNPTIVWFRTIRGRFSVERQLLQLTTETQHGKAASFQ